MTDLSESARAPDRRSGPVWNTTNNTTHVNIPMTWPLTLSLLAAFVLGIICRHYIGG